MDRTEAETVGLRALGWIAATDNLLDVFLGSSGLDAAELRAAASRPQTLLAALDFVVMDDAWVVAFCDTEGLAYQVPLQARATLAGRREMHWT